MIVGGLFVPGLTLSLNKEWMNTYFPLTLLPFILGLVVFLIGRLGD